MDTNLVDRQTEKILHEKFHLASLYPYQNLVIRSILERGGLYGKTARTAAEPTQLVVLPTGSGKSVCFMLPALLLEGLTVVVYPLLSLMNDQMRRMEHLGCRAVMLRGGQTAVERQAVWKQLEEGTSRFVISNAETLSHPPVCERLARLRVSLLVIDEAHTVTQWGESFRPAYLGLHAISRQLNPSQVVAFTATASPRIIERVTKILFGGERPHMVYGNPDRPNIRYRVLPSLVKMHDLQMLVTCAYSRPMLIFCSSRARCEHVAWELYFRTGVSDVRYYHAGLARDERERTESWFFHSTSGILVSTSAYGMGVDKRDIRTVIHLDIPADTESFLQESGRAGRDGSTANSIVLVGTGDSLKARRLEHSHPYRRLHDIFCASTSCRRAALVEAMGFPLETCDGCDVCANKVVREADGEREILGMIRRHPLRYRAHEAASVLCGNGNGTWDGVLGSWEIEDARRAVMALVACDKVRRCRMPPFKGRLHAFRFNAKRLSLF